MSKKNEVKSKIATSKERKLLSAAIGDVNMDAIEACTEQLITSEVDEQSALLEANNARQALGASLDAAWCTSYQAACLEHPNNALAYTMLPFCAVNNGATMRHILEQPENAGYSKASFAMTKTLRKVINEQVDGCVDNPATTVGNIKKHCMHWAGAGKGVEASERAISLQMLSTHQGDEDALQYAVDTLPGLEVVNDTWPDVKAPFSNEEACYGSTGSPEHRAAKKQAAEAKSQGRESEREAWKKNPCLYFHAEINRLAAEACEAAELSNPAQPLNLRQVHAALLEASATIAKIADGEPLFDDDEPYEDA